MKLPKKISPCPIVEAVLEIQFETSLSSQVVFAILFNELKDPKDLKIINLPVSQIPENIRENDPVLKYSPYYQFTNNNYKIKIGSKVIAICFPIPYTEWANIFPEIMSFIEKIERTNVIKIIHRIGLRVIDFFQNNIYKDIKLKIINDDFKFSDNSLIIRSEIINDPFTNILQIANNAQFNDKKGSIIDLDTIITKEKISYNKLCDINTIISNAHEIQKKIFFGLLADEFLKTLNPIYE